MKFDREAPGEGAEAVCSLENGKAVLEWRFYFAEESEDCMGAEKGAVGSGTRKRPESMADSGQQSSTERTVQNDSGWDLKSQTMLRLALMDMQGNTVLEGLQPLLEEEPLRCILLHPRLWNGTKDPYLYRLEAYLTDRDGRCLDHISRPLPLRTLAGTGEAEQLSLNGEPLERRAVSYCPTFAVSEAECQRLMAKDFGQLLRLGANCVFVEGMEGLGRPFMRLCDRYGFLLFSREKRGAGYACFCGDDRADTKNRIPWEESVPCFRGGKGCLFPEADGLSGFSFCRDSGLPGSLLPRDSGLPASLFFGDSNLPTSLFYRYLAKWSRDPFVYLVPESVKRLKSGNYSVCCYSNCERIVLYSDGALFEFQRGKEEFTFSEVPARTPCVMLMAEGDGCSASLSLSKSVCPSEKEEYKYHFR